MRGLDFGLVEDFIAPLISQGRAVERPFGLEDILGERRPADKNCRS